MTIICDCGFIYALFPSRYRQCTCPECRSRIEKSKLVICHECFGNYLPHNSRKTGMCKPCLQKIQKMEARICLESSVSIV